ncbi:MAG TPA: S53 family peptidase [Rhizomicrobium sp.]|jgi:subtilase family serine protease
MRQQTGRVSRATRRRTTFLAATALLASLASGPVFAKALLSTHVPEVVAQHLARAVGVADPNLHLELDVALPMRDQAGLDALLQRLYDPASPLYRHYLSVAQFTDRFGPTAKDYARLADFLRTSGLTIKGLSANRYMVEVDGTAADIERVFHVRLNLYQHPTESRTFVAPDREPTLDLDVPVLHVTGLDDFQRATPRVIAPQNGVKRSKGTGSGPGGDYIGSDMRAAYYGGSALTGQGQSLGLMELEGYNVADVQLYFTTVDQPLNVPVNGISTDGTAVSCTKCNDAEQVLDIEYAISMAPGLQQVQVYVGKHAESVLNAMASDNTSKQLSTSWGWRENFATDDPLFKEMAAQGQSFLTASGDYSSLKESGPWPEEDANLTGVGGTDLVTNGAGGSWAAESGWNDSAGGPSLDKKIKIESYQLPFINKQNQGSHTLRNVPDIAANSDFDFFICHNNKCNGGWAGTSFASPILAGYVALANEQAANGGGETVGFLNPALYALGNRKTYDKDYHDAIGHKSGVYKTVKGFDLVTGLGSPNGQNMIDALVGQ